MTSSRCVFESILSQYFQSNFGDMLAFRPPQGSKWVSFGCLEAANQCTFRDSGGTMVPEWLQGSKKEPFWVALGCVLGMFGMYFWHNMLCKMQWICLRFWWPQFVFFIKDCKQFVLLYCFFVTFCCVHATLQTWSRSRRQARPKTTGVARTCQQKITLSVSLESACAVFPTVVKHFFSTVIQP